MAQVVHGKMEPIEMALICLLAEGHLLIEDVPGVGKTSLAKSLAASIDCSWKRVQFTPDLLPADLVGVSIYERSTEQFRFSARARCSPTSCSPTRSTGRRRRRSRRCSRRWRSARSPSTGRHASLDAAVHGHRHPEPGRPGGHVPPAGEPARPLPAAHRARLPGPRRGDGDPRRSRRRGVAAEAEPRRVGRRGDDDDRGRALGVPRRRARRRTSSTSPRPAGATRRSSSGCRRGRRCSSPRRPGRTPPPAAGATPRPTTSR